MSNASNVPTDPVEAAERLRASVVPSEIVDVARRLQEGGHASVLVGGAVRDALLGLDASDWDLATSATPEEVQGLFRRTIPTGLEHGTVTVLVRNRSVPTDPAPVPVEVTTFRGEGDYVDGRRPSSVTFHRDLHEDLARRDFTINAFAWDPVQEVFSDPFGGLADLEQRKIRAVGDPALRFAEDGLRTMRAVRLSATRRCVLDPATRDAIEPALPVLDKVSRERVHVELFKLLGAVQPSRGLKPMAETGMWSHVLVELPEEERAAAIAAVDALPAEPVLRLARLLWPAAVGSPPGRVKVFEVVAQLRPSRAEQRRLRALISEGVENLAKLTDEPAIRRNVAALGREHLADAVALLDLPPTHADAIHKAIESVPLSTKELEIKGRDLIAAGLAKPGRELGELMDRLLQRVFDDPSRNEHERLLAVAREEA